MAAGDAGAKHLGGQVLGSRPCRCTHDRLQHTIISPGRPCLECPCRGFITATDLREKYLHESVYAEARDLAAEVKALRSIVRRYERGEEVRRTANGLFWFDSRHVQTHRRLVSLAPEEEDALLAALAEGEPAARMAARGPEVAAPSRPGVQRLTGPNVTAPPDESGDRSDGGDA